MTFVALLNLSEEGCGLKEFSQRLNFVHLNYLGLYPHLVTHMSNDSLLWTDPVCLYLDKVSNLYF
jgi:hypothetical protein